MSVQNAEYLKRALRSSRPLVSLIHALQEGKHKHLQVKQLTGSLNSFYLWMVDGRLHPTQVYIARNKEEAAYVQNTLDDLIENRPIHFFPDSFRRPGAFHRLDSTQMQQRTEVANSLTLNNDRAQLVVTYPEALLEPVISPNSIRETQIILERGEDIDLDHIIELMVEYGFQREGFVYEPGQFSIRGGIVDIFSFGNEWPYRIELFDDEVESIRTFDPVSQLSKRNIQRVSIVPNVRTNFKPEDKVSFLDVLPGDALLWLQDVPLLTGTWEQTIEKFGAFRKDELPGLEYEEEVKEYFGENRLVHTDELMKKLQSFTLIFERYPGAKDVGCTIEADASPQKNFNKNFKLLIEDLKRNQSDGLTNFIFTENPRQIKRFYNIFEDLNADVHFHPVNIAIHRGFTDRDAGIACYTDHEIFQRFHRYNLRKGFTKDKALNLKMLRELSPGDYVTHIDHGIGKYSGLEKININGHEQESVRLFYKNDDILYVSIHSLHKISKYVGKDGTKPRLSKLGSNTWARLKRKTKKKVKDIAQELIKLYAKRRASEGFEFPPDGYLQNELEASFIYEDTPDQLKATEEVKEDMMKPHPMDRLICGDVGFGKTEVAIRAAFKAVVGGKQVAVLVPTTILALQHNKTFKERLGEFGISVDFVNRFRTGSERKSIFKKLREGKLDIIIGTHSLLNKKVKFKNLGLLIVDEEQKFGVTAKEKLRKSKVDVDTLTLTATPIPRTLQFSLMAARDLSIMRTAPPNRRPIHTETRIFNEHLIKEAIEYEVNRGGQVFFVHNRVKSLDRMLQLLKRICPDIDFRPAHGQMEARKLEKSLVDFIDGNFDVLLCTNIIETGLDIPNVNTIIINNAHQFGLSDLHQLRGRVGRSNRKAFCYLFSPPLSTLTPEARKRLRTIEEFSDLGSGFHIAMRDLDIRGAGNLLGAEQSGFIADIGYKTYQKILDESIQELKENEFKDLFEEELKKEQRFVRDVDLEADIEMLIPDHYVSNIQERLNIYTRMDRAEEEKELSAIADELGDRFGPLPPELHSLLDAFRMRWSCKKIGFGRIVYKNKKLQLYFVENPQSTYFETDTFRRVLDFVNKEGKALNLRLKQKKNRLAVIAEDVGELDEAMDILHRLEESVQMEASVS